MNETYCEITKALEVQFTLENMIHGIAVLARVAVIELIV